MNIARYVILFMTLLVHSCTAQDDLIYKVVQPIVSNGSPAPMIVLLHGWGSDETDLIGLSNALPKNFIVVSVRAPFTRPEGGYAWYQLQFGNGAFSEALGQAAESAKKLNTLLPKLVKELNADPKHIFLGGFSQGAIMSLRVGLQAPFPVCGVICLSGRFPPDLDLSKVPATQKAKIPVFAAHGTNDNVIPVSDGRNIVKKLKEAGIAVTSHEYPMAHQISKEEMWALKVWLEKVLK